MASGGLREAFDISPESIREGPLARVLVALAAPLLVQNVVQVGQQLIDIAVLGRYSEAAVAAVGLVTPVWALAISAVAVAPFVGTQVLVSQRVGAETVGGPRRAYRHGLLLGLGLAIAGGGLLIVAAGPLVGVATRINPGAEAVVAPAVGYLTVLGLGLPGIALSDTTEAALVGWGDSRASLYMNLLALGANAALDPVFVFGLGPVPELGAAGAALATGVGYAAGFALGTVLIARGHGGEELTVFGRRLPGETGDDAETKTAARIDRGELRELLAIGAPTAGQEIARQVLRVGVVAIVLLAGGAAGVTAYVIGSRVASVAFIPATGLQQAAQSMVGQNLGADNLGRAGRTPWVGAAVAAGMLAVVGTVQWALPTALVQVVTPTVAPTTLALGVEYLRILAYGYPALGAVYLFQAGFNGIGRTQVSFVATLLQYGAIRLPAAAVAVFGLAAGVIGVFWAITLSNVVAAIGLAAYYHRSVADGMLKRAAEAPTTAD